MLEIECKLRNADTVELERHTRKQDHVPYTPEERKENEVKTWKGKDKNKTKMEKPLVNKKYLLEKVPEKGGWTYVVISEISQDKRGQFGQVKVKGTIDDFEINNYRLMPMSNGKLFFPIKADIRKKIGKQKGDFVHIILYVDDAPTEIPSELLLCLLDNPPAHKTFLSHSDAQQKAFIDWIYSAKRLETRIDRIAKTLNRLENGMKFGNEWK